MARASGRVAAGADWSTPDCRLIRIREVFEAYPHIGKVLPAVGYGPIQLAALETTIEFAEVVVVSATPVDLAQLLSLDKKVVRARYEFAEAGEPSSPRSSTPLLSGVHWRENADARGHGARRQRAAAARPAARRRSARRNLDAVAKAIAPVARQHDVVITHGNGPQVGLLALQAAAYKDVQPYPLDVLGAESEGMIGYLIEQTLSKNCRNARSRRC